MELDMTKGKPLPVLLRFTLPLLLGNVFQQFYNMADTVIVGRFVGAGALAAVGSTGTIMFLINGFAQGITSGFSILTSQRFGAGDPQGVRRSVANGVILAMISTLILTMVCLAAMMPWARTYMNICASFFLPLSTIFVFRNVMQGCGYGFLPMMGGFAELVARLSVAVIAMKVGSYALAVFCHPAAWTAAALFTGISYLWVIKNIEHKNI
jgi:Na+-driven multidrug efflux pump